MKEGYITTHPLPHLVGITVSLKYCAIMRLVRILVVSWETKFRINSGDFKTFGSSSSALEHLRKTITYRTSVNFVHAWCGRATVARASKTIKIVSTCTDTKNDLSRAPKAQEKKFKVIFDAIPEKIP